jgi:hypothetical protein
MTFEAGNTVINIAGYFCMLTVCGSQIVATETIKNRIVPRVCMAVGALIPLPFMFTRINREIECIMVIG